MANLCRQALDDRVEAGEGAATALLFVRKGASGRLETKAVSYAELRDQAARWAGGFRAIGLAPGAPVALYLPKRPELYAGMMGAARMGAVALPALDQYRREVLRHRLRDSGATAVVTESGLLAHVPFDDLPDLRTVVLVDDGEAAVPGVRIVRRAELLAADPAPAADLPDDHPLILHYTAGAMGKPKGILHAHRLGAGLAATAREALDVRPGTRIWCTAHPGWVMGSAYNVYGPLLCGATAVVNVGPFEPAVWMRILDEARVEVWYTVPSALHRLKEAGPLVQSAQAPTALRLVMTTGERLSASLVDWCRDTLGIQVRDSWWMTETGAICLAQRPGTEVRAGSVGVPVTGLEAAAVDPQGRPLPPNQIGFLAVRRTWPSLMASVWKDEKAYAEYFIGDWFVSRDYAHVDDDGHYHFQGRTEETIKVVAERVNPFEVEDALLRHAAVAEVAVIGKPGPEGREVIKAFVVLVTGFEPGTALIESLRRHVADTVGPFARPGEVEFLESLPKTRTGKVLRRVLKARETGLPAGDTSTMAVGRDL